MSQLEIRSVDELLELSQEKAVMLYFHHPLCTACQDAAPAINQLMEDYPEMNWSKINLEQHPDIAAQNMVFTVPTLIIIRNKQELYRLSRFIRLEELNTALENLRELGTAS